MTAKPLALLAAVALSGLSGAQAWIRSYDSGLAAARAGKWSEARQAFQQAASYRPDDRSGPTNLPGPATERKIWRNGAPYSPNFLAAYSLYREGVATLDPTDSAKTLRAAAGEFETLVAKDQSSAESYFYLDLIYMRLGDEAKRRASADRVAKLGHRPDFKIDTEIVAPEEIAALQARTSEPGTTPALPGGAGNPPIVGPGTIGGNTAPPVAGNVAPRTDKFALVIGQSGSRLSGGLLTYAATDAERVRASLVDFAGYPTANVVLLQNVSASEMKAAAAALSAKLSEGATVTIFYAGAGANLDGRDYLAGADTESASDVSSMLPKADLYQPFIQRGARLFAFFEVNRSFDAAGGYFGHERPSGGQIAEIQSTKPGDTVTATYRDNKAVGLFANAFALTLANLRSNQIAIQEFTWQLVNVMRRGNDRTGGGGKQVCTLPQLNGLGADSKF